MLNRAYPSVPETTSLMTTTLGWDSDCAISSLLHRTLNTKEKKKIGRGRRGGREGKEGRRGRRGRGEKGGWGRVEFVIGLWGKKKCVYILIFDWLSISCILQLLPYLFIICDVCYCAFATLNRDVDYAFFFNLFFSSDEHMCIWI